MDTTHNGRVIDGCPESAKPAIPWGHGQLETGDASRHDPRFFDDLAAFLHATKTRILSYRLG
jgi:hypothetical protein